MLILDYLPQVFQLSSKSVGNCRLNLEACGDTRLFLESIFVIPLENTVSADSPSIVYAIVKGAPNAKSRLLAKYGSALSFLIGRHCWEKAEQFHAAVADATIDSVLRGVISADDALPKLIQATFRRLLPDYAEDASRGARVLDGIARTHSREINAVREDLRIFTPLQLQALARYVKGDSIAVICSDLGLLQVQFSDTRKVARQIARFVLEDSDVLRKPSRLVTTEFTMQKVAG
jgi:hypothetical protein